MLVTIATSIDPSDSLFVVRRADDLAAVSMASPTIPALPTPEAQPSSPPLELRAPPIPEGTLPTLVHVRGASEPVFTMTRFPSLLIGELLNRYAGFVRSLTRADFGSSTRKETLARLSELDDEAFTAAAGNVPARDVPNEPSQRSNLLLQYRDTALAMQLVFLCCETGTNVTDYYRSTLGGDATDFDSNAPVELFVNRLQSSFPDPQERAFAALRLLYELKSQASITLSIHDVLPDARIDFGLKAAPLAVPSLYGAPFSKNGHGRHD